MTISFDLSKPERRPIRVTFITDEDTAAWLNELMATNGLDNTSLLVHRIVKAAKEAARAVEPVAPPDSGDDRRQAERRSA